MFEEDGGRGWGGGVKLNERESQNFGSRRSTEIVIRGSCCFLISFCYHHKHHCNVVIVFSHYY